MKTDDQAHGTYTAPIKSDGKIPSLVFKIHIFLLIHTFCVGPYEEIVWISWIFEDAVQCV